MIDHIRVAEYLEKAFRANGKDINAYPAEVYIGDQGTRFALRVIISDLLYHPAEEDTLAARVEVLNSVDRTLPLRVVIGFFRFVCCNGLVMGRKGNVNYLNEIHLQNRVDAEAIEQEINYGMDDLPNQLEYIREMVGIDFDKALESSLIGEVEKNWGKGHARELSEAFSTGIYKKILVPGAVAALGPLPHRVQGQLGKAGQGPRPLGHRPVPVPRDDG